MEKKKLNLLISFLVFFGLTIGQDTVTTSKAVFDDSLKFYQTQKLRHEIKKLNDEISIEPIYRIVPSYGAILAALVAVFGSIFSFYKYLGELKNERERKRMESFSVLESKFDAIVSNLGSNNVAVQSGAVVSLLHFLEPEHERFHYQVYLILLANLKIKHIAQTNALLVKAFEKAIRLNINKFSSIDGHNRNKNNSIELDLSRTNLQRIDLQDLNLENIDLAFSDLRNANLSGCNLRRAKGYGTLFKGARLSRANLTEGRFNCADFENVQLHNANLVSVKLKKANLTGAEFHQAKLQEANFDSARIYQAKFEQSNLKNAFLRNIKYDVPDLKSITRCKDKNWRSANFDNGIKEQLEKLDQ